MSPTLSGLLTDLSVPVALLFSLDVSAYIPSRSVSGPYSALVGLESLALPLV